MSLKMTALFRPGPAVFTSSACVFTNSLSSANVESELNGEPSLSAQSCATALHGLAMGARGHGAGMLRGEPVRLASGVRDIGVRMLKEEPVRKSRHKQKAVVTRVGMRIMVVRLATNHLGVYIDQRTPHQA